MKTDKPVKTRKAMTTLESTLPGLFKTFIEGGITTLSNKHIKGLSRGFQQNAIAMCEVIAKYGTSEEQEQLTRIYNQCLRRKGNGK